ncbi:MAG TPA: hypothetical protein VI670_22000 [Thermoanaerobaculia bacterium]|jgi:hypothetical protein
MNLYLLFAIALGAITGTTEAPVPRPAFAVVAKSVRAEVEDRHSCLSPAQGQASVPVLHGASWRPARIDAPLTGAGTPRAPSA